MKKIGKKIILGLSIGIIVFGGAVAFTEPRVGV